DSFDLVVSSMAIHNIDENEIGNHARRFQALDEAVRVLKSGGRLVLAHFWSGTYAKHLRDRGMLEVQQRSLGWRSGTYQGSARDWFWRRSLRLRLRSAELSAQRP